jgi:hypothetical protein
LFHDGPDGSSWGGVGILWKDNIRAEKLNTPL